MVCTGTTEWFGWIAAFLATAGSLVLVRPLFILLRYRESLESLVYALESDQAEADLKEAIKKAKTSLSAKVFAGRKNWKLWAYAGLILLGLSLIPLFVQAICLS